MNTLERYVSKGEHKDVPFVLLCHMAVKEGRSPKHHTIEEIKKRYSEIYDNLPNSELAKDLKRLVEIGFIKYEVGEKFIAVARGQAPC